MRRRPVASLVSVLCLALGIGASAAAVALLDATVLRPYGLARASDLVVLWESDPARPQDLVEVSLLNFQDWERQARSFEAMAAFGSNDWPGIGRLGRDSFPLAPRGVSQRFFRALGVSPALGRDFTEADLDPSAEPPVMVSDAFWVSRMGASPDAVGATLFLSNEAHRVIGVMPRGFAFPDAPDVWISVERILQRAFANTPLPQQRGVGLLEVVGRLKPGVTRESAAREISAIAADLQRQHYPQGKASVAVATPFTEMVIGRLGARLWIALGMTTAVLLFACANVAALRFAHLRERAGELSARLCLGASRRTLTAQLLGETAPLVAASVVAAAAVAVALEAWLTRVPVVAASGVDMADARAASALALAVFALVSWALVSAAPALAIVRGVTPSTVPASSRTVARGSRSTSVLLLAQAALAICLVAMAGGAFRTFARLAATDMGFSTAGATVLDISVPDWKYPKPPDRLVLDERLLAALRELPGATAVGGVSVRPFRFGGDRRRYPAPASR